jgi:type IV pilus assembly protein PilV
MRIKKYIKFSSDRRIHQGGATLIEALVSILVMSIGLLGIAGLQLNAMLYQKNSWSTNRVAEVTNDLAERIRANPTGAIDGNYSYTANYATGKAATFTSNNCRTSGGFCSTAQIAADDLTNFILKSQASLPGGAAQITGSAAGGFVVTTMFLDKDFTDPTTHALQSSQTCTAAIDAASADIAWRNCCPAAASAPAGVRCRRFNITP